MSSAVGLILLCSMYLTCATAFLAYNPAMYWETALGVPMPLSVASRLHLADKGVDALSSKGNRSHNAGVTCFGSYRGKACGGKPPPATLGNRSHKPGVTCFGSYRGKVCGGNPPAGGEAAMASLFFGKEEMKVGATITTSLPSLVSAAPFLPPHTAQSIAFGNRSDTMERFHIAPGSEAEAEVNGTMRECAELPIAGEKKTCEISLEGVVETAMSMLGTRRVAVAASALPSAGLPRRDYNVRSIRPLGGSRIVVCHSKPYPYAVYLCHMTGRSSAQAFAVAIRGGLSTDAMVSMVAVCHMDTSEWAPSHPAFATLRTHPGGKPICHFLPYADLVFSA